MVKAAPVPYSLDVEILPRNCREEGCMYVIPSSAVASSTAPSVTAVATSPEPIVEIIDLISLASGVGSANDESLVAGSQATDTTEDEVTAPLVALEIPVSEPSSEIEALAAERRNTPLQGRDIVSDVLSGRWQRAKRSPSDASTDNCRGDGCM